MALQVFIGSFFDDDSGQLALAKRHYDAPANADQALKVTRDRIGIRSIQGQGQYDADYIQISKIRFQLTSVCQKWMIGNRQGVPG